MKMSDYYTNDERLLKQIQEANRTIGALKVLIDLAGLDGEQMVKCAKEIAKNE